VVNSRGAGQRNQQETAWLSPLFLACSQTTLKLQPTGRTFHGSLNQNIQLADQVGRLYLLRQPHQERRPIYAHLSATYREEGFSSPESAHGYRTIVEQARFMRQAVKAGIRVLQPLAIAHDATSLLMPFLQAEPLDEYLQQGKTEAVGAILRNLTRAHHKGIVLGDRWGANTLITPAGIVEVDFDIALEGPLAKEFELGKLFYHLLFYAADRQQMLAYLDRYLHTYGESFASAYELARVQFFVRKHAEVFGARQTVVIDTVHQSNIPPVSQEHTDHFISIVQAMQGKKQGREASCFEPCLPP